MHDFGVSQITTFEEKMVNLMIQLLFQSTQLRYTTAFINCLQLFLTFFKFQPFLPVFVAPKYGVVDSAATGGSL